jgi:hypothetical protein
VDALLLNAARRSRAADHIVGLVAPGEVGAHGDAAPAMLMLGVGIGLFDTERSLPAGDAAGPSGCGTAVTSRVAGSRRRRGRSVDGERPGPLRHGDARVSGCVSGSRWSCPDQSGLSHDVGGVGCGTERDMNVPPGMPGPCLVDGAALP